MYSHDLRFRIQQEQQAQTNTLLTALLVVFFAVVTTALGPQIFYEYFLQNAALEQQMLALKYIPVVSYGLAALFFVGALVGNFSRSRRIRFYQQELEIMNYMEDCCDCEDGNCENCLPFEMESDMGAEENAEPAKAEKAKPSKRAASTKKTAKQKSSK